MYPKGYMYPSLATPGLGLEVRFRLGFSTLIASVVQLSARLLCVGVMLQAADE